MNIFLGVAEGLREINAHKFRSFLTMLGVVLGVGSLMATFAITAGMAVSYRAQLKEIGGVELVQIRDAPVPERQEAIAEISPGRTYRDVLALRAGVPLVSYISPEVDYNGKLTYLNRSFNPRLIGVEPDFLVVNNHRVAYGRFITSLDLEEEKEVIVLGRSVVDELWQDPNVNPIGETVRLNGVNFTIVGIFERYTDSNIKKQDAAGIREKQAERRRQRGFSRGRANDPYRWKNTMAVIPLSTMIKLFKSARVVSGVDQGPDLILTRLTVQVKDMNYFDDAIAQMKNVLNITHRGIEDYGFDTREDWFDSIERGVRSMQISGGLIAGIGLLVGGLGITNIMLASITQRVREIGIRRAVGATAFDIFTQILIEGIVLALIGGLLGLVAGLGLIRLLQVMSPGDSNPVIELPSVVISLAFAIVVGVCAGIYPAWKASQLSPLEALRYE